jgi:hypothetical protein
MARLFHRLALGVLAVTLAGAASPASALSSGLARKGGFSVRPATSDQRNPATRAYFIATVGAGDSFHRQILVSNLGRTPLTVYVYPTDGLTGVTSGSVYGDRSDPLRRAGRWLSPPEATVTLPPRGHRLVGFTVHVPLSARPGDHLAGVAFENTHPSTTPGRFSITTIVREVIGVDLHVPGRAAARGALLGLGLDALAGTSRASVVVSLANRGELMCKPELTVTVAPSGSPGRVVRRPLGTVLAGDAIPYPLPWPAALSPGTYHVSAQMKACGAPVSLERMVRLGRPLAGSSNTPAALARSSRLVTPWWLIVAATAAGMSAGLLAITFVLFVRRRKRRTGQRVGPAAAAENAGK